MFRALRLEGTKMNNIMTLLKKDIYEMKNNYPKNVINYGAPFILIIMINATGLNENIFSDSQFMFDIILIVFIATVLIESTLFQTSRYIKCGVFEKYFLNKKMKVSQIYLSKYIFNLVLVCIIILLSFFVGFISDIFIGTSTVLPTHLLLIKTLIFTNILTSFAFVASLSIKSENNLMGYMISITGVFIVFYKVVEILSLSWIMQLLLLILIMMLMNMIVFKLTKYSKLISKG